MTNSNKKESSIIKVGKKIWREYEATYRLLLDEAKRYGVGERDYGEFEVKDIIYIISNPNLYLVFLSISNKGSSLVELSKLTGIDSSNLSGSYLPELENRKLVRFENEDRRDKIGRKFYYKTNKGELYMKIIPSGISEKESLSKDIKIREQEEEIKEKNEEIKKLKKFLKEKLGKEVEEI